MKTTKTSSPTSVSTPGSFRIVFAGPARSLQPRGSTGSPGIRWDNWRNFVAHFNAANGFLPTALG